MALRLSHAVYDRDPYDIYAEMRQQEGIALITRSKGTAFFVARYEDVISVLKDPRFTSEGHKVGTSTNFGVAWWMPNMFKAMLSSMIMLDEPDHGRLRTLVHKAFTPRRIQQMVAQVEAICNQLLDEASTQETVDLISGFTLPLPLTVISEMMGISAKDRLKFQQWTSKFIDGRTATNPLDKLPLIPNTYLVNRFFHQLIEQRRSNPQDDLISALVDAEEAGDRLDEEELVSMLMLLLLAGYETTANLIGNGLLALLQHPDQLEKLKANPALIDTAIEEMLRFTNPVQQVAPRFALEDLELHGQFIPKGSSVICGIASANRDESVFPNADQFDITRTPNHHLALGLGIHYCLGGPLARLEAKHAFQILFSRFPNLELAETDTPLEWRPGFPLRGLKTLPVHLH